MKARKVFKINFSKRYIFLVLLLAMITAGVLVMMGYQPDQKTLEIEVKPFAIR